MDKPIYFGVSTHGLWTISAEKDDPWQQDNIVIPITTNTLEALLSVFLGTNPTMKIRKTTAGFSVKVP
jgi:hypothetical protein